MIEVHEKKIPLKQENGLCVLDLNNQNISDFSDIKGLESSHNIQDLRLDNNRLTSIPVFTFGKTLRRLSLANNRIIEIGSLEGFLEIEVLDLSSNKIKEIKGLQHLKSLQQLNLARNQITTIEGIDGLESLQILNLEGNPIAYVQSLSNLPRINTIKLISKGRPIDNINGISNLSSFLESLNGRVVREGIGFLFTTLILYSILFLILDIIYPFSFFLFDIGIIFLFQLICFYLGISRQASIRMKSLINKRPIISPMPDTRGLDNEKYIKNFITAIKETAGIPLPSSKAEGRIAGVIKNELSRFCDHVSIDSVLGQPSSFLSWVEVDVFLMLFLYFTYTSSNSFILGFGGIFIIILYLTYYVIMVKPRFFPKSTNVMGKIAGAEIPHNIISFSCHLDTAPSYKHHSRFSFPSTMVLINLCCFILTTVAVTLFVLLLIFTAKLIKVALLEALITVYLRIALVIVITSFVTHLYDRSHNRDREDGQFEPIAVLLDLARYLSSHPESVPRGTEIRFLFFGCGTVGLRGARSYIRRHKAEISHNMVIVDIEMVPQAPSDFIVFATEPYINPPNYSDIVIKLLPALESAGIKPRVYRRTHIKRNEDSLDIGAAATVFARAGIKSISLGVPAGSSLDQVVKGCLNFISME